MVQKLKTDLDSSKEASDPDCILIFVLKIMNLNYLADFFIIYLKKSCFPDCWSLCLRMLRRVLWQITTILLVLFLLFVKSLKWRSRKSLVNFNAGKPQFFHMII